MSKAIGDLGESCAAKYLQNKNYKIIQRNYHSKYGEIDIIVCDEEYIVFVEVKTRKVGSMIRGLEFVDRKKQNKIIKTAFDYLQNNCIDKQIRFDVVEVEFKDALNMFIRNHVENAFTMEEQYEIF